MPRVLVAFGLAVLIVLAMVIGYLVGSGVRSDARWADTGIQVLLGVLVVTLLCLPRLRLGLARDHRLRQEAHRLGHAAQAANLGLWTWDVGRDCFEFDELSADLLGVHPRLEYGQDDLLGCLLPQDRESLREALSRCIVEGKPTSLEYRMSDASGSARWVYAAMTPEQDRRGRVVRVIGMNRDITARRAAEEETEQSRLIMQQMGRVARIGGWRLNLDPPELIWSDVVRQIHEVPDEYIPSLAMAISFYTPEARLRIEAAVQKAIESGESWDLELGLITYQGRKIWVRALGVPKFENGVCTHLLGSFQDITEQYQAMDRVRESEQRLDLAITASRQGLWDWDVASGRTYFSEMWYTMLGYEPGALPMTFESWHSLMHPEDLVVAEQALAAHFDGRVDRYLCETRLRRRDGAWHWVLVKGRVAERDGQGQPRRVIGVHVDIDERKRSEQLVLEIERRLRCFVENTPAAVAMFDRDMRYLLVSDGWFRQYGIEPQDLSGRSHYEVFPEIPEHWREIHRRCLEGETIRSERDRFDRLDGTTDWLRWVVQPWRDSDGGIGGIMMVTERINAQIEYEQQLAEARDVAERASRAKSEFLANMSHEIRTPMAAILGFTALLNEPDLTVAQRTDAIRTISRNGDHLLAVINDILDLSKIEAGKMTLERLDVDPAEAITDVHDLMSAQAAAKGLELSLELVALPSTIQTDPTRLRQILANLLSNAIKFTESGTITIRADWEEGAPGVLRVAVTDTGIGIPEDTLGRVFEAFSQGDDSMSRRFGGTGLGLKISRRLAQMLDGDISVESRLGHGSTFTVTFRPRPEKAGKVGTSVTAEQHRLSVHPLQGIRVLIAEDGPDNQRLISFYLRKAGAEVTVTNNGVEVLEAWDADPRGYQIIILDMQMPEIDGYQAAWSLRRRGWRGPVLALTAHAMAEDRDRCLAAGCSDYGSKPIDRGGLIRMCLDGMKAEDAGREAA